MSAVAFEPEESEAGQFHGFGYGAAFFGRFIHFALILGVQPLWDGAR